MSKISNSETLQKYAKENFGLEDLAKDWEKMFYTLMEEVKTNPISPYQPTIPYTKPRNNLCVTMHPPPWCSCAL